LAAEAASLVVLRAPDDENSKPERPIGLDPQETFRKHDETSNAQNRNSVGIQIMKLNPISEKETSKERMRGSESPRRRNVRKSTRKPAGGRGMISRPAARVSAGSFFRMPIFSLLDSYFSWTLVWTHFPTTGMSVSAVLAFFAAVPPAAPAAVELLLPMKVALNEDITGMGGRRDASQEQSARKKMIDPVWC
jgi:hypothetical protein